MTATVDASITENFNLCTASRWVVSLGSFFRQEPTSAIDFVSFARTHKGLEREGMYKDGTRVGIWKYFGDKGELSRTEDRGNGLPGGAQ